MLQGHIIWPARAPARERRLGGIRRRDGISDRGRSRFGCERAGDRVMTLEGRFACAGFAADQQRNGRWHDAS